MYCNIAVAFSAAWGQSITDKVQSWEWKYGQTPEFEYSMTKQFEWGEAVRPIPLILIYSVNGLNGLFIRKQQSGANMG